MHQLDALEVAPKEPAVKFYNDNRQQQCNISMQAQEALQAQDSPPIILRHSELRKSDYSPETTPTGSIKGIAWPSSVERRFANLKDNTKKQRCPTSPRTIPSPSQEMEPDQYEPRRRSPPNGIQQREGNLLHTHQDTLTADLTIT
jgi:hypothetical protein